MNKFITVATDASLSKDGLSSGHAFYIRDDNGAIRKSFGVAHEKKSEITKCEVHSIKVMRKLNKL